VVEYNIQMRSDLTVDGAVLGPAVLPASAVSAGTSPLVAGAGTMVAVEGVSLRFEDIVALDEVSLDIQAGEILCLLGPSGSGKSSLLRVVAGIEHPSRGRVRLAGIDVAGPGVFVEPEQRRVGMVFQDYALFPHLTVEANVAFGLKGRARAEVERTIGALLERLGLTRYATSYPHVLSGGERQRVALARALAPKPRVLLMDEPFSSLDGRLRDRIRQETLGVLRETRTTTIVVTHDPGEAMRIADRIALLRAGRLLQVGSVEDLYSRPATAFAARFLSDVNELVGTCCCGRVDTALGSFSAPHMPDQSAVRVCIRPQHVRVAGGPTDIRARVVSSEFLGETDRVTLEVMGVDAPVLLRVFGRAPLSPGDAVFLDVDASGVVVVPDDAG
jgi:iron(III) transport system ATP-binding protein